MTAGAITSETLISVKNHFYGFKEWPPVDYFMKDTGIDAFEGTDEQKINAGRYLYFHILASDLIEE